MGELLPLHGIQLKWDLNQSLIPKILSKVIALIPPYNICLVICAGHIVPGPEKDGMAISFLPQLSDRVPACGG